MTSSVPTSPNAAPTDPEDVKIITLARAALARTAAASGACLRDTDGRTYAAASVNLPHLQLSAVTVAVAMAVSSGAEGLEAIALAGTGPAEADLDVLGDLRGPGAVLWHVDARGQLQERIALDGAR
ncbi:cytidine deaminase [uncultured Friedmanniella sp.]|uniref:cytidine deaminase n=1 Tax=uncultured Friedmanniella sp. TaxID=335381 RepID=UPI0035CB5B4A